MRYLAVLAKENKLPINLHFSYTEILNDLTITKNIYNRFKLQIQQNNMGRAFEFRKS